jgi:hypothetical protein
MITHDLLTRLDIGSHSETISLGVIHCPYSLILGLDFLKRNNPSIDWIKEKICFPPALVERTATTTNHSHICSATTLGISPADRLQRAFPPLFSSSPSSHPSSPSSPDSLLFINTSLAPCPPVNISLISEDKFFKEAKAAGSFSPIWIHDPPESISATSPSPISANDLDPDHINDLKAKIPVKYHDLLSVFTSKDVSILPPHRPYDCSIDIQEGQTPPFGPIYSSSHDERTALAHYIEDNLKKGFIRRSSSSAASPILFVKKRNGDLHLCVDYRSLNAITKRNRYPLPLIDDLLDRVQGWKVFTSLDLKNMFNLIRIASGDKWKTFSALHLDYSNTW